ncbi:MAG: hypothetical protein WDM78_14350 [Puia sp.]
MMKTSVYDDQSGGDPNLSEISILAPSMRDKSLAPENHGTLTLYMPACMDYKNEWETQMDVFGKRVRGAAYQQLKKEWLMSSSKGWRKKLRPGCGIIYYFTKWQLRLPIGVIQEIRTVP